VDARRRLPLRAQLGLRMPSAVEQDEHCPNAVLRRHSQIGVDPFDKADRVGEPQKIVKIHSRCIHAKLGCPPEFTIDNANVE